LHVFICIEQDSNLRFIFVCEDNSEPLMQELHGSVLNMVDEFKKQGLLEAMELCESDMFSKISKRLCWVISVYRYARGTKCTYCEPIDGTIHCL
jgi:hypothetical protein